MTLDPISAFQTALGINRKATYIVIGGFVAMVATVAVTQLLDDDRLTFWQLLVAMLGLMVVMIALTQLPVLARRLISWVLTLCFLFVTIAATGQAVTANSCPRLATAHCIISFHLAQSCEISSPRATAIVTGTVEPKEVPVRFAEGVTLTNITLTQGIAAGEAAEAERVYIQFAGYDRDEIVALADALLDAGWHVEGADRGGERIRAAMGLNEIRYFNPADADRAMALAEMIATTAAVEVPAVIDLSQSRYGQTAPGLLEIWVSD